MKVPKIITEPVLEPLTIEQCRAHLNLYAYDIDSDGVSSHPDDSLIYDLLLPAAREACEDFLGMSIATKTLEIALDEFPEDGGEIELPMQPVVSIVSVMVGTTSDALMTADEYILDTYSLPHCLKPSGSEWPTVTASTNLIKVRYIAGFGEDSDGGETLPFKVRAAILFTLSKFYDDRAPSELPAAAEMLLRPMRIRMGMA